MDNKTKVMKLAESIGETIVKQFDEKELSVHEGLLVLVLVIDRILRALAIVDGKPAKDYIESFIDVLSESSNYETEFKIDEA